MFIYNTLEVKLFPLTKSIKVFIKEAVLSTECIFELETLLVWLSKHIEISSVLLTSIHDNFGTGISPIINSNNTNISKIYQKLQKLTHLMNYLPQTIIVDIKKFCINESAELALGADIIIASNKSYMQFNHLLQGKTPQSGGIGILKSKVGLAKAKYWILSGAQIQIHELVSSGLITITYQSNNITPEENLLQTISRQSPTARIQAKRSLLESNIEEIEKASIYESLFAKATLQVEDWKEFIQSKAEDRTTKYKKARDINLSKSQTRPQASV